MVPATCFVGDMRVVADLPPIPGLQLNNQPIGAYFEQASRNPATGLPAIGLGVDGSRFSATTSHASLISDDPTLFAALGDLLPPPATSPDPKIGLLLAMSYQAVPQAFGVMFDINGAPGEPFGPRQGCAVFLEGMFHSRAWASDAEFADFVTYVAIHEIGHAFNLWHELTPSFMFPNSNPNNFAAVGFTGDQDSYLATADGPDGAFILPGLTPFGQRGPHAPTGIDNGATLLPGLPEDTALRIALSRKELWSFEALELELRFGNPSRDIAVPDVFDPRHDDFRIWITTPRGERRRYRPQTRVCVASGERVLKAGEPYERDISIFVQSGGYTFDEAGVFSVQVELHHDGGVLRSNTASCEVKRGDPGDPEFRAAQDVLRSPAGATLLRFRHKPPTVPEYERLLAFVKAFPVSPAAAAIHYALGRALLKSADKTPPAAPRFTWLNEHGRVHLARALEHRDLGLHARRIAETLVN